MGSAVFSNPETYYVSTRLTGQDSLHLRYLFIELHNVLVPKKDDWLKVRFKYYMDLPNYAFAFNAFLHQKNIGDKPGILKNLTAQFIEHSLNMDLPVNYLKRLKVTNFPEYYRTDGGFLSAIKFTEGRENFDTVKYSQSWDSWKVKYRRYKDVTEVNAVELNKILHLIAQFKARGIHLIFILPPKSDYSALQIQMGLYNNIPAANKINMADPYKYPEFYHISHAHDRIHLNLEGARLYTQHLAEEFTQLVYEQHLEDTDSVTAGESH
jgi:hypothetical protein